MFVVLVRCGDNFFIALEHAVNIFLGKWKMVNTVKIYRTVVSLFVNSMSGSV